MPYFTTIHTLSLEIEAELGLNYSYVPKLGSEEGVGCTGREILQKIPFTFSHRSSQFTFVGVYAA